MKIPNQWIQMAIFLLSIILIITIVFMAEKTVQPVWGSIIIIILVGFILYLFYIFFKDLQVDQMKKLVLIGQGGVGKTFTYKYLECQDLTSYSGFTIGTSEKLCIVDTPDFDLESTIEIRECNINLFQNLFNKNRNSIRAFLIVVNFERTDLMKQKIIKIIKFIQKFNTKFYLLITNFELCENQIEGEQQLKQALNFFNFEGILFLDKNKNNLELKQELLQIQQNTPQQELSLNGTIFEKVDQESQQLVLEQIFNNFNKKSHKYELSQQSSD